MIDYNDDYETMEAICDGDKCSFHEFFEGNFQECIGDMKVKGWLIKKPKGEFLHFCPSCAAKIERRS